MMYMFFVALVILAIVALKANRHLVLYVKLRPLTKISRQIARLYFAVPVETRPDINIISALMFMDAQCDRNIINAHFSDAKFIARSGKIFYRDSPHRYCHGSCHAYKNHNKIIDSLETLIIETNRQHGLMKASGMTMQDLREAFIAIDREVEFVREVNREIAQ